MNQGFPCHWARRPRRGRGHWFYPDYMPNENVWSDGSWNDGDNCFRDRPAPEWDQHHPVQQWAYDSNNYNFRGRGRSRGNFHKKRPYRGRSYRGSKSSFSKGRFQKSSRSTCSVDLTPNKKESNSEKVEKQSTASKETREGKEDSAVSVNETDPPKVSQEASCTITSPREFSFRLPTDSLACPEGKEEVLPKKKEKIEVELAACSETEGDHRESCSTLAVVPSLPVTLENLKPLKEEEGIEQVPDSKQDVHLPSLTDSSWAVEPLVPLETEETIPSLGSVETELVKLKVRQAAEDPPSQTAPISSAGEPTEEQTPPETTEGLHPTEQEDSVLLEASHASAPLAVEIPFLSEAADDHWCEKKEEIDLNQISGSCEDVDHHQTCAAPAINSSSLPSTISDIRCVPVLVREEEIEWPYSWETASFHAENLSRWAPEDYQEPPWSVNQAGKCDNISENDRSSVPSQSPPHALISCNLKCDTGRLLEHHTCSPKSHHSSDSKHSGSNWAPRELRTHPSRSPRRRESRSRSPHGHRSRSPHGHRSRSPHRQEHRSRSSLRPEHSPHRQEQSSRSPWRRREDFGRNYCHYEHSCNPSRENSWERESSSLSHEMNHHHSAKERSKTYKVPYAYSPEGPTAACKMKTSSQTVKKKKLIQPEGTEKKKRRTSEKVTKSSKVKKKDSLKYLSAVEVPVRSEAAQNLRPLRTEESDQIQMAASREAMDSHQHPSAGEETGFSVLSWTQAEQRSAAVLARKEEIEQAYLQALLNFAVVAAMLLEKEPCMEEAMESALRANLRGIGNYYEDLLKNYIDSLAEAS